MNAFIPSFAWQRALAGPGWAGAYSLSLAPTDHDMPDTPSIPPTSPTPARRAVSAWWRALAIFLLLALFIAWAASASMVEQLKA